MEDFNFDLFKYNTTNEVSHFLESMCSNSIFPLIMQPTCITTHSKTVIDNIFLHFYSPEMFILLTASKSDHLAQFITMPYTRTQTQTRN